MRAVRIATRQSPLALWQARHVAQLLVEKRPDLNVSLVPLSTEGDRFLQDRLSEVGGKGLFVKEIEQALLDGRADLAVHSLKDMTSALPPQLCIAAVPPREDPRDAWVSPGGLSFRAVPKGSSVGTSSLRRACQLLERRPDLRIVNLRGNVQTRLRKTTEQGLAGTVLALAGLRRLGLDSQGVEVLEPDQSLPAVGQGALAIQCPVSNEELRAFLLGLDDRTTRLAVTAERSFLAALEGNCKIPLAGYAVLQEGRMWLRGLIGRPDGTKVVRGEKHGPVEMGEELGRQLAADLLERGAQEILDSLPPRSAVLRPSSGQGPG